MKAASIDMRIKLLAIILLTNPIFLLAGEIHVSSITALQSAIYSAVAGDVILLDNGTYLNNTLTIGTNNITVRAATPGGVLLNGTNEINISGNYITFSGFQFTSGSIEGIVITVSGNYDILTQLNFKNYSAQKCINLQGQYDEISFCNFENKPTTAPIGNLIHIAPNGIVPNYAKIRYCSFKNMPGKGGDNGNECIRIANGAQSTYTCRAVIEYCYFNNTGFGDSEEISVKCRENVIRYCTFDNNPEAMLVFRNGDRNIAYGNFFINGSGGIRCKEANDIYCYNNYFEKSGVSGDMNAVTYVYYTVNTTHVLSNINFINNTFVDCGNIDFDKGATNNTWANNIFKKISGNIFTGSVAGISFAGNIHTGNSGVNISSGMTNADPKLVKNVDGYWELSSSSPAIDASSTNYPAILDITNIDDDQNLLLDIKGQTRPASAILKDVGCSEYNATGTIINRPLKLSDVGPTYLISTSAEEEKDISNSFRLLQNYPNPFNPNTVISYQLSTVSHVLLKVYDLLGREVVTLVDEIKQPGFYNSKFSILNSQLSSGLYFYRLTAEKFSETKKMILIK